MCTTFSVSLCRHLHRLQRCPHPISLCLLKAKECFLLLEQEIWVQETGQAEKKHTINKHTHRECVNYTVSSLLTASTPGVYCLFPWPVSTCSEKSLPWDGCVVLVLSPKNIKFSLEYACGCPLDPFKVNSIWPHAFWHFRLTACHLIEPQV